MSGKNHVAYKVMLVEDDESFRRTFAGFLLARFPSIVIEKAADGAEAIERIQDFLPDLVFMDIIFVYGKTQSFDFFLYSMYSILLAPHI
jgi:DNA-binding NarL/FixJ family response regulator